MLKRSFDIFFSLLGLIVLSPIFLLIAIIIIIDTAGGVFYLQQRVGKNNVDFFIYKFRTMRVNSDQEGLLTVGIKDNRITKAGLFLRKYKLDELPQLINVLKGEMSFVGPRPEVRKYVAFYTNDQKKVLQIKPGITDYASIFYSNENKLLDEVDFPEKFYIEKVIPAKLELNLKYIAEKNFWTDLKIIFQTIGKIVTKGYKE